MFDAVFRGVFDSNYTSVISLGDFLKCVGCALAVGLILAGCYMVRPRCTKGFVATLALLPAVVCVVIMMVNGNVGAGVAVAGAFSLVRFRSAPGTAEEIGAIFLAMATGLIAGMGYLAYAILCAILLGGISLVYCKLDLGETRAKARSKTLRITIPEDLNYTEVFQDILGEYTRSYELLSVKTTNMGSLFRLTYNLVLKDTSQEKEMIDRLRCHNGNLEICIYRQPSGVEEL